MVIAKTRIPEEGRLYIRLNIYLKRKKERKKLLKKKEEKKIDIVIRYEDV